MQITHPLNNSRSTLNKQILIKVCACTNHQHSLFNKVLTKQLSCINSNCVCVKSVCKLEQM